MKSHLKTCSAGVVAALAGTAFGQPLTVPFPAQFSLASLRPANGGTGSIGFVIDGVAQFDLSGWAVTSAGDVNGDGFDDLLIGAPYADPNGQPNGGKSYVVFGGAAIGAGGVVDLSGLNGSNGFLLNGFQPTGSSGHEVGSAGDVNDDGYDDLVIGAPFADPGGQNNAGEAYVVFGGPSVGASGVIELSTLNGTNGFIVRGTDANDFCGNAVSGAGDLNGDGVDDFVIGAYGADAPGNPFGGQAYVIFGGAGVGAGGLITAASLNGTNGFLVNPIESGETMGSSVGSAGDANGDGFDDLLIGSCYAPANGIVGAGRTYVVFGGPNVGAGGVVSVASLDGEIGFVCNGIDQSDKSGFSVAGVGDVNGDGIDDFLIGANRADPNGLNDAGESYLVFGGPTIGVGGTLNMSSLNGSNGFVINGAAANAHCGFSVDGAGDMNGDGFADLIMGQPDATPPGVLRGGGSLVLFGGPTVGGGGVVNLSTMNGANGFAVPGFVADSANGYTVSSAGDVNGDGVGDVIIGSYRVPIDGKLQAGESYVIFGRASANVWTSPFDGAWDTGSNWQGARAPLRGFVTIDVASGVTVNGPTGAVLIDTFTLHADAGQAVLALSRFSAVSIAQPFDLEASSAITGEGTLIFGGPVTIDGALDMDGMSVFADAGATNSVLGTIAMTGGAHFDAPSGLTNDGSVSVSGASAATVTGDMVNTNEIVLADDSALTIVGTLSGNGVSGPGGGGTGGIVTVLGGVIPRTAPASANIAQFDGDLKLGTGADTIVEIGGTTPGVDMDQVAASGQLRAGGTLHVEVTPGFSPTPGDVYQVVSFGSAAGSFSSVVLDPALVNAGADASQLLVNGTIFIPAPSCAGDINGDGFTNASDFTILAGNFGASVPPNTSGDLNGDGLVNAADFVILAGDFGCAAD